MGSRLQLWGISIIPVAPSIFGCLPPSYSRNAWTFAGRIPALVQTMDSLSRAMHEAVGSTRGDHADG